MSTGRCDGCGTVGNSRVVGRHILSCGLWQALYRDGAQPLLPEAAYARWSEQSREGERDARREAAVSRAQAVRDTGMQRFARKDILEDL